MGFDSDYFQVYEFLALPYHLSYLLYTLKYLYNIYFNELYPVVRLFLSQVTVEVTLQWVGGLYIVYYWVSFPESFPSQFVLGYEETEPLSTYYIQEGSWFWDKTPYSVPERMV